jgi:hypothetical protein
MSIIDNSRPYEMLQTNVLRVGYTGDINPGEY